MQLAKREYQLRKVLKTDAAIVARHRSLMFLDMGDLAPQDFEAFHQICESWIAELLEKGKYIGWFLEFESMPVAGGGIMLLDRLPSPACNHTGSWAHVINIYTDPEHRRYGLARRMMLHIIDWCRHNDIDRLTLGASKQGRSLYESLGFEATSQMRLAPERMHALVDSMESK